MSDHVLLVYFTHSGNTRKLAELLHEKVGGELFEIQPEIPYPDSYNTVVEQAKKEIRDGYKPALKSEIGNLESYNTIFVGSPNWWSTIAPPVAAFLSKNDLSGKTIVPFCTHGGGGLARIERDITKLCPQSTVLESFEVYGSAGGNVHSKITDWLQRIGVALQ
ncbi:MAG TPA: flavodoxin [Firmicutes bacterium]|jgi:flavodoxin|nr:flavodoxin [Bacillota bacterium]